MNAVETRALAKHYRRGPTMVRALDGVDLTIARGEFMAVVGRSGSGKTTLLDCIGALMRPTSGTVSVDGVDTGSASDALLAHLRGEKIGFIFQEFNLIPSLTAMENVMLPLRYTKHAADARDWAVELLRRTGLSDRAEHRPAQLSGGEQQRVAVARALVNRPALVLGDEPTGELDSETGEELISLLRQLNRDEGVTVVIVTHDSGVAERTDRIVRLKDGSVISDERR